jgi:hypothetical protein
MDLHRAIVTQLGIQSGPDRSFTIFLKNGERPVWPRLNSVNVTETLRHATCIYPVGLHL